MARGTPKLHARNSQETVVMSSDEIIAAIDQEARARMGISGETFIERWLHKDLPDSAASWEIGMLVRLLDLDVDESNHRNGTTDR